MGINLVRRIWRIEKTDFKWPYLAGLQELERQQRGLAGENELPCINGGKCHRRRHRALVSRVAHRTRHRHDRSSVLRESVEIDIFENEPVEFGLGQIAFLGAPAEHAEQKAVVHHAIDRVLALALGGVEILGGALPGEIAVADVRGGERHVIGAQCCLQPFRRPLIAAGANHGGNLFARIVRHAMVHLPTRAHHDPIVHHEPVAASAYVGPFLFRRCRSFGDSERFARCRRVGSRDRHCIGRARVSRDRFDGDRHHCELLGGNRHRVGLGVE